MVHKPSVEQHLKFNIILFSARPCILTKSIFSNGVSGFKENKKIDQNFILGFCQMLLCQKKNPILNLILINLIEKSNYRHKYFLKNRHRSILFQLLTFKYFTLQICEFSWNSIFARTSDSYLTCLHRDPWAIEEPFQPFLLGWCIRGNSASPECIEPWSRAWRELRRKRAPVGANQIWHP